MKKSLLIILLFLASAAYGQKLSDQAQIYVITCSPGSELYSKFGHSAIRIYDPVNDIDLSFNYGTFDFNTPHFYLKFIQGRLNYMLSVDQWRWFVYGYAQENRWVLEQKLNLTQSQKQKIFDFLMWNAQEQNRYYKYEFFLDNCATRVRDVIFKALGDSLVWNNRKLNLTYRKAFAKYVADRPWLLLGMNLINGPLADRKLTLYTAMFLPDYVKNVMAQAKVRKNHSLEPLVIGQQYAVIANRPLPKPAPNWPLFTFIALLLIITAVSYLNIRNNHRTRWIDFVLFLILGLGGLILVLLWAFTDHPEARWNLNMLWAFPTHLFAAFFMLKNLPPKWVQIYSKVFIVFYIALLIALPLLPQHIPAAVIPIILMAIVRLYTIVRISAKSSTEKQ